jgi:hypothetical protein
LVLIETNEIGRALGILEEYLLAYPSQRVSTHRAYLQFLQAGAVDAIPPANVKPNDLERYWGLELRVGMEGPTPALAEEIERALEQASETTSPLHSLQALVLHGLDRREEAVEAARRALEALTPAGTMPHPDQRGDPDLFVDRAYRDRVEKRARDILGSTRSE